MLKTEETQDKQKLAELKTFIAQCTQKDNPQSYLIAVLHKTQEIYEYVPRDIMDVIADEMNIPTAHIWGVATFYHYFNLTRPGKYTIQVCLGTACYVKGAAEIMDAIKDELNIEVGQVTDDGVFSLQGARCLGACGLAPVIMINDKIHGDLTPDKIRKVLKDYRKLAKKENN